MIFSADLSSIADSEEGRRSLESSPSPLDLSFSHKEKSRPVYLLAGGTSDSMVDKSTKTPVQSPEINTPRQSLSPIVQSIENNPFENITEADIPIKEEDPLTPRAIFSPTPSPSSYSSPSPQSSIATTDSESQCRAGTPEPIPSVEQAKSKTSVEDEDGGPLDIYTAKSEFELVSVLHLITDSIAKQRELATKSILYNPIYWIGIIVLFDYLHRILYYDDVDWIIIVVAWSAALMCTRHGVKIWVNGYIDEAERVGRWSWLFGTEWIKHFDSDRYRYSFLDSSGDTDWRDLVWVSLREIWVRVPGADVRYAEQWLEIRKERDTEDGRTERRDPTSSTRGLGSGRRQKSDWEIYSDGERIRVAASKPMNDLGIEGLLDGWLRDMVFVARFKGRIIGALVMRAIPVDMDVVDTAHASGPLSSAMGQYVPGHVYRWKAVIRAWNVEESYRGFGVGRNILQYAIEHTVDRGWDGPEFAVDHANSLRILPAFLNGKMDRMEKRAKKRLVKEIETYKCVIWNT